MKIHNFNNLKENNFNIVSSYLQTDNYYHETNYEGKIALVIGNEANGVSDPVKNIADEKAIIPMLGKTESLNASIATGVILYEYVRQKLEK